eukprot:1536475-Amphidinium_carterae.1
MVQAARLRSLGRARWLGWRAVSGSVKRRYCCVTVAATRCACAHRVPSDLGAALSCSGSNVGTWHTNSSV